MWLWAQVSRRRSWRCRAGEVGVADSPGSAVAGVAGDETAAVGGGVVEDVVDVPVGVVVGEDRAADAVGAGGDSLRRSGSWRRSSRSRRRCGCRRVRRRRRRRRTVAQVAGMNCMRPWAPAELVVLLRPCAVSSIPIPASRVQGRWYRSAAATYNALMSAGIGRGGLFREFSRGVPGGGSSNPMPPCWPPGSLGPVPGGLDGATACR
jgi:hypothetical protein